jgi:hypothetical protein
MTISGYWVFFVKEFPINCEIRKSGNQEYGCFLLNPLYIFVELQ